jgi:hypothetical protein
MRYHAEAQPIACRVGCVHSPTGPGRSWQPGLFPPQARKQMPSSVSQVLWFLGGATVVFLLAWFFGFTPFPRPTTEAFLNVIFSAITAVATAILAKFTITLAKVGNRQIADTRILQRAYIAV